MMPAAAMDLLTVHDLHLAVRVAYRAAMSERRSEREAFDAALAVLLQRQPQGPTEARRAVAVMLATDPNPLGAYAERRSEP